MADIPMFTIEENTFLASQSSPISQTGLLMQDSHTANQTVYRNSFIGLDCGEKFSGYNNYDGYAYGTRSVLPVCNTHADNSIDIGVYSIHSDPDNEGVSRGLYLQGPTYLQPISLGNTFSSGTNIYSNTVFPTTYWANMQNPAEIPANSFSTVHGNVYVYQGLPHACLSRYGSDVIVSQDPLYPHAMLELGLIENRGIDLNSNSTLAQVYTYYKGEYNNMLYLYNQLMDGGNTEALLDAVQGEWSDDVWKIRQKLISQSPFVSEEVLREIAKKNLLPQALLLEICLANPDATRNPKFIHFLQYEKPNPMPAYMIALIKGKWDEKTLRTVMEEEMSGLSYSRDFYFNRMLVNMMADSTLKPDVLRGWLLDRGMLNDYFLAAESYLQEGNFDGAFSTIYDYTQLHPKLDEATLAEIKDYLNYLTWLEKLAQSGQNIYQLKKDGSDIATLAEYERTSTGRGRVLAHNILCGLYDICLEELPEKSQVMASGGVHGGATSASAPSAGKVQVFPNPAKEYASFIWDFGSFDGTAQLSITDQSGRPLLTRSLPGAQGQWIWETGSVPSGSYVYSVIANGLQIESGKIVVTK
jgi:hypothetical protein